MKRFVIIMLALFLFVLSGCNYIPNNNDSFLVEESEYDYISFENAISLSDVAFLGKIEQIITDANHTEFEVSVRKIIFGNIEEKTVHVFPSYNEVNNYKQGQEYVFVAQKKEYVMYDYDRYIITGCVYINLNEKIYTQYDEPIQFDAKTNIIDHIASIYSSITKDTQISTNEQELVIYNSATEEMVAESTHVGIVKVAELFVESTQHNGNVYTCYVEELFTNNALDTYEDGSILLVLLKGSVEIGEKYLVGFYPASEGSLIYTQTTLESILENNEENINIVKQYVSEIY